MKADCEAQCDHVFYGCARQMQELVWKGADRWCVGGCVQLQKGKKKGTRSWKKNIAIKIAQNCEVTVCTRPLWLRLYLPLLPVCAWPPPLSYLYFDHYSFFLQTSLLLWLHTRGRTHAPFLRVFSLHFFLAFLHSLGITLTLINITALNIPFPFLVLPLLFHHLPLLYLLCASVFVPVGLPSLSCWRKHTSRAVVTASQGQWIVSRYKYPNCYKSSEILSDKIGWSWCITSKRCQGRWNRVHAQIMRWRTFSKT